MNEQRMLSEVDAPVHMLCLKIVVRTTLPSALLSQILITHRMNISS
jgi:hypothetical protein